MRPAGAELRELTAPAPGGVSVLEVRGAGALAALARLVDGPLERGAPRLVRLTSGGELLDEALVWVASEERVELHLHGSRPLVRRVARELGLTLDEGDEAEGEAHRGLEERAERALAGAASEAAARVLLDQAEGALRCAFEALLAQARAGDAAAVRAGLGRLIAAGRAARPLFVPPRVVLAGAPNAGKSTLFNALVGRERAVVDPELGTTRDALEERVALGPWTVDLVDTAGLRALVQPHEGEEGGAAEIERAGQERTRARLGRADLVLWLEPRPDVPAPDLGLPLVRFTSRADELDAEVRARAERPIAARDEPDAAREAVSREVPDALGLAGEPWVAGRAVPFDAELRAALERLSSVDDPRAVAEELARRLAHGARAARSSRSGASED